MSDPAQLERLVAIMDRLRDPGGCPWDREQDFATLRGYLIEECYEVVDAIDADDLGALCEELGDLLFQIVFLARLARERGAFDAADVVRGIAEKMVRRHPHVFGAATAETSEEVLRNWERIKREERTPEQGVAPSVLEGVPRALPALLRARRLGEKAARVGFDWSDGPAVLEKVDEELRELHAAGAEAAEDARQEELGDLLFTLAMLARHWRIDPEDALQRANRKFERRFRRMEAALRESGLAIESAGIERLERLWNDTKAD